jgi:hypothetical protein
MHALQKQQLRVKRQGRVLTVYVDPLTDRPLSISGYDDEPPGGFPKIMQEAEALSHFGARYDLVPVDPPAASPQLVVNTAISDAELDKIVSAGDREAAARRKQLGIVDDGRSKRVAHLRGGAPPPSIPPTPSSPTPADALQLIELEGKVFKELETLFAKRSVATGKLFKELNFEIQAIGNFLLRVEPALQPALVALSERHKNVQRIEF